MLVRVALGGFLGFRVRWVRFLLTFLRLCACSDAVREEILRAGGSKDSLTSVSPGEQATGAGWGGGGLLDLYPKNGIPEPVPKKPAPTQRAAASQATHGTVEGSGRLRRPTPPAWAPDPNSQSVGLTAGTEGGPWTCGVGLWSAAPCRAPLPPDPALLLAKDAERTEGKYSG